jgi:hypothetical protein
VIASGPLGLSFPSALTNVAKSAYRVVSDPRAQAAAAVVGNEYAPDTTAQVQETARNISRTITRTRMILNPATGQMVPASPMPDPGYDPSSGGSMPVQHSNMLVYAGIGGAALILYLILRK